MNQPNFSNPYESLLNGLRRTTAVLKNTTDAYNRTLIGLHRSSAYRMIDQIFNDRRYTVTQLKAKDETLMVATDNEMTCLPRNWILV